MTCVCGPPGGLSATELPGLLGGPSAGPADLPLTRQGMGRGKHKEWTDFCFWRSEQEMKKCVCVISNPQPFNPQQVTQGFVFSSLSPQRLGAKRAHWSLACPVLFLAKGETDVWGSHDLSNVTWCMAFEPDKTFQPSFLLSSKHLRIL